MPRVTIARNILAANEEIAADVRRRLAAAGVRCINLMSGPGAGKTTLLERSVARLRGQLAVGVIEGDIETSLDAERIEAAGAQVVQINTRGACHLEAHMVRDALETLNLQRLDLLFIENIGNLVCPAAWDLGEDLRAVVVSTTEGDEKPAKYPQIFAAAQVLVLNKMDLLPYVDYDPERVCTQALAVNPGLQIFALSCRSGEGLDAWCDWLLAFTSKRSVTTARETPYIMGGAGS
ncbi:hydrogenase nickel incorporation protein HypB [Thermogemmatispora sp.]|uniref:hydrogenase nickel incorporation protein HypB n=1 Tax=Thermogemmatispora sp. TaxID=1968838 RepID=UPI001DEDD8CC|nr:hydrogenase nickel incorporation protein HypB [Thermogemmatispora sp.]MBX5448516.1 hydrogenase nickel incorporation protein HypB [Thermogemmatispora sp.]